MRSTNDWRPWQIENAGECGKHTRQAPVDSRICVNGYWYDIRGNGNALQAFPARGAWAQLSWEKSPQVKAWLDEPETPMMKKAKMKILAWLKK